MKILMSLNHLTAAHVVMVGHKRRGLSHQRKLRHHCAYYHGEQLLSDKWSYLVIRGRDLGSNCNLRKLVINQSLEILPAGVEVACRQESYFGTTYGVTKETYLKECERINALFKKEAASPSASTIYRQKVAKILGEE
jgi:hypothetical protein